MLNQLIIKKIENIINEKIINIEKLNIGYSREVYIINNKYILKIASDVSKEEETKCEIKFLESKMLDNTPRIIYKDLSKIDFPFIYHLETKLEGDLLLYKWQGLSECDKHNVLTQIIEISSKLHSKKSNKDKDFYLNSIIKKYDEYLKRIQKENILSKDKIRYLNELKLVIPDLFSNAQIGLIHGDLHFNNILINEDKKISIIDFEKVKFSYIEKEYDPINRMSRNPNAFSNNSNFKLDASSFSNIINYIMNNSIDISNKFADRLLLFDCMNSLMWLYKYPNHSIYKDVLFDKSKKLLK